MGSKKKKNALKENSSVKKIKIEKKKKWENRYTCLKEKRKQNIFDCQFWKHISALNTIKKLKKSLFGKQLHQQKIK